MNLQSLVLLRSAFVLSLILVIIPAVVKLQTMKGSHQLTITFPELKKNNYKYLTTVLRLLVITQTNYRPSCTYIDFIPTAYPFSTNQAFTGIWCFAPTSNKYTDNEVNRSSSVTWLILSVLTVILDTINARNSLSLVHSLK